MILESILGSVTGILGSAATAYFKIKEKKLDLEINKQNNEHELKRIDMETRAMIAESKAQIRISQNETEGEVELADSKAFIEAQKADSKKIFDNEWINGLLSVKGYWKILTLPLASIIALLFGFVDFLKNLVRPALTIYLMGVTTWITHMSWKIMQMNNITLTAVQATAIFTDVINVVTYLTVSACSFYFCDRRLTKNVMEMKGIDTKKLNDNIKF